MILTEQAIAFLTSLGVTEETASKAQLSDALAYSKCYDWYIEKQKVLPENAGLAAKVFIQKYALHDSNGICLEETPEQMWDRLAEVLAEVEMQTSKTNSKTQGEWEKYFREGLTNYAYSPQGSGLYSLGNPYVKASSSNCFIQAGPKDNLESIADTAKEMMLIYAARGGVGFDLGKLRPAGAITANAAKTSTGAVSFSDFYSYVTGMIGQCIEETQRVLTIRGNIPIKEVISGDMVWTRKGWVKNLDTLYNGIKPIYKLTTKRGYSILATDNHVFLGEEAFSEKEKQLKDFKIGDNIITLPGTSIDIPYVKLNTDISCENTNGQLNVSVTLPEYLTEDMAYFLGYSYGDGHTEKNAHQEPISVCLSCGHKHPEIEQKLVSIVKNVFSCTASIRKGDGAVNKVNIGSKKICAYLQENGLLKQKHDVLVMPEAIWQSKTSVQMAFISGYFDADGYASGQKKGYVIASVCMPILKAMQQILMAAGIVSHISTELRTGKENTEVWKDLYSLIITGKYAQNAAITLLHDSIKISNKQFIAKRDNTLTPFNAKALDIKYNNFSYVPDNTQYLSANTYTKLLLENQVSDNITILDTVSRIEYVGEAAVYDLKLEKEHLFVSEGMIVHNCGRRGALMVSMPVTHPDIMKFINEKQDLEKQEFFNTLSSAGIDINDYKWSAIADRLKSTSHANVSVRVNDKFMKAVKDDEDFELFFEFENGQYPRISKTVKAKDVWDSLMKAAWESAEPGILNWDHILRECPADQYAEETEYSWSDPKDNTQKKSLYSFRTVGVNPCAEISSSAGDSCNLGIFNLPIFVKNPYTETAIFDWDKYKQIIELGVRAQDNIKEWDLPRLPLEVNRLAGVLGRRISVNNTGLADCLAALGLRYDSDEGIEMAEKVYAFMANTTYQTSAVLAKEKGAFPAFDLETHLNSPFIQRLEPKTIEMVRSYGLRNIALLTQAPAGSMSILFRNCSSGIEPVFMLNYTRNVKKPGTKDFEQHIINHQAVEDCFQAGGDPSVFVPAGSINYSKRIQMQSHIQKHIDHSISSTINLPNSVTVEEVSKIYMEAYDAGLKGITVYRDGCRTGVLVPTEKKSALLKHEKLERPKTTNITIHKTKYRERNYMILVGMVNGQPIEVFGGEEPEGLSLPTKYHKAELTKKSRGHYSLTVWLSEDEDDVLKINNIGNRFPAGDIITLTRMISISLRNNIDISEIVEQLNRSTTSLYDAPAVFARVLKQYVSDEDAINKEKAKGKVCPECKEPLEYRRESSCLVELCSSCSYSNSKCN